MESAINSSDIIEKVGPVILTAGRRCLESQPHPGQVDFKSRKDPVTATDRAVEEFPRGELAGILPGAGFFGEAGGEVSDIKGGGDFPARGIVATNGVFHQNLLGMIDDA